MLLVIIPMETMVASSLQVAKLCARSLLDQELPENHGFIGLVEGKIVEGKFIENPHIPENLWFPVGFPLNQSIERYENQLDPH